MNCSAAKRTFCTALGALSVVFLSTSEATAANHWKFDFGPGKVRSGYTQVLPSTVYNAELGYGFLDTSSVTGIDHGGWNTLRRDACTSDKPFYFSVAVPEGNYNVQLTFGDSDEATTNTVRAELRRLMLENVQTKPGKFATRTFTVNVRTPRFGENGEVRLKPREKELETRAWDDQLTLEFNGARPCVCAMAITPAPRVPTLLILGDSTVCDQPAEPWNSWGQMLPRFFKPGVAVANHAESGESIASSLGAHRFDKVFSLMKKGDWLFIQYGHNDMKDRRPNALQTYKSNLKEIVARTRELGGTPVLITPMERKAGVESPTLEGYPDAVREMARQEGAALIDLNAMSLAFYRALGEDIGKAFQDGTHHNNYGSYELARCIVEGIKSNKLALTKYIADDVKQFDPAQPDSPEDFSMPPSPGSSTLKPEGN